MDKKIKIGMITDNFYPTINGIVKVSDNLTKSLKNKSDVESIYLACPSGFNKEQDFGYQVVPCKAIQLPFAGDGFSFVPADKKFKKFIKETDVDIYHCQTISTLFSFVKKVAKKKKKPFIVTVNTLYHNDVKMYCKFKLLAKIVTKQVTKIYNSADEVWTINQGVKDYLISFGIDADKIRILNNGCDLKKIDNLQERKARLNAKYNITNELPVFCFVGRLYKYKNIFFILDSLIELHKRNIDFRMFFCGGGGTDKKRLIKLIKKNNLQDKIFVLSKVPAEDLLDIYTRADLQLFPSVYDSDGLVKYEASSCGTPTLLLKGAISSIGIEDNVSGFIAENSVTAYADRIESIINDRELLEKVSNQCADYIIKSWDTIAVNAIDLYKQAIDNYNKKNNQNDNNNKDEVR
ncbi:MAG: glycosyltransferase [Clostridia bacterium]|nr:glycosyltransferase [Clostridia bacterium]